MFDIIKKRFVVLFFESNLGVRLLELKRRNKKGEREKEQFEEKKTKEKMELKGERVESPKTKNRQIAETKTDK